MERGRCKFKQQSLSWTQIDICCILFQLQANPYMFKCITYLDAIDHNMKVMNHIIFFSFYIAYVEQSYVNIYNNFTTRSLRGELLYNNSNGNSTFRINFIPPILLRNLGITNKKPLTICELKLIESGKLYKVIYVSHEIIFILNYLLMHR